MSCCELLPLPSHEDQMSSIAKKESTKPMLMTSHARCERTFEGLEPNGCILVAQNIGEQMQIEALRRY